MFGRITVMWIVTWSLFAVWLGFDGAAYLREADFGKWEYYLAAFAMVAIFTVHSALAPWAHDNE